MDQSPDDPYIAETASLYLNDLPNFERKVDEFILKYATPTEDDLKIIEEMNNPNKNQNNKIKEENEKM